MERETVDFGQRRIDDNVQGLILALMPVASSQARFRLENRVAVLSFVFAFGSPIAKYRRDLMAIEETYRPGHASMNNE